MALSRSSLNYNPPLSASSSALPPRRILSRVSNLKANSNDNAQDTAWYNENNTNESGSSFGNVITDLTPRVRRINPFRKFGRRISRDGSFDEPPNNLNKLFADSSVPGVRDIAGARNILRKTFWLCCFFILAILALKDISQLIAEYYLYPITVNVRLRDSRLLLFPAITVCNLNIVRYSALCNSSLSVINMSMIPPDLADKLCGIQSSNERSVPTNVTESVANPPRNNPIEDINNYGNIGDKWNKGTTNEDHGNPESGKSFRVKRQANSKHTTTPKPLKPDIHDDNRPSTTTPIEEIELTEREEKELQENMTNWLAVMHNSNERITKMLGHQFEDMILRCTIKTTNCTHPNSFEQIFTPTEGNCFTYKSFTKAGKRGSKRKKEETSLAGVNYGLELVLNLEIHEYLPGSTQIGALVMVHHPDDFGNSASEAIFIAPQQATYIGLKMVNISRLPAPYPEDCIDVWPEALKGRLTQNATYSQQACLKICLQKTIQRLCNCQSAMLPQLEINSTLKICDTRRKPIRTCVEEIMIRPEDKVDYCQCPPRCKMVNYEKTVSVARWPTREDRITFDRGKANINFQNLAKVVIYFQTMTCQDVIQQSAYTTAKLLSSLGGILGMYVGFSFLSLFEILEVLIRRLWYCFTRKKNRFKAAVHTITAVNALSNGINGINHNGHSRRVHFQGQQLQ